MNLDITLEHCISPGLDVDSILLAILTVSPKRTNLREQNEDSYLRFCSEINQRIGTLFGGSSHNAGHCKIGLIISQ